MLSSGRKSSKIRAMFWRRSALLGHSILHEGSLPASGSMTAQRTHEADGQVLTVRIPFRIKKLGGRKADDFVRGRQLEHAAPAHRQHFGQGLGARSPLETPPRKRLICDRRRSGRRRENRPVLSLPGPAPDIAGTRHCLGDSRWTAPATMQLEDLTASLPLE